MPLPFGDPLTFGVGTAVGLGLQAYGMSQSMAGASAYNQAAVAEIGAEEKVQGLHEQFMELDSRRKQLENLRNTQKARAMAVAAGASQGASFSSGVAGGEAQVMGHGAFGASGLAQSLMIGRGIYQQDLNIDKQRIAMSNANLQMQYGSGMSSLGQSIMGGAGPLSQLI